MESLNFIEHIIEEELKSGKVKEVITRFPPEPNGYLHIGHAQSIWLNFSLGKKYKGKTNLRFDDTNPLAEESRFVEAIKRDIAWLGFEWEGSVLFASDYFPQLYEFAQTLIKKDLAYVDDSTLEEIRRMRGVPTSPGDESPFRNRSVEENLDLLERMKSGEFEEGSKVLRAKIDMSSPNMHLRDPILYRIIKSGHHRTGEAWCIYPMYDFAHGQSDYIEGITHSICTLEFEIHRPLYDWFLDHLADPSKVRPRQIEFARLNLNYTITSKRNLKRLVEEGHVDGWDDPRMPTISGMRRRGYPASALTMFAEKVGVAKRENVSDMSLLEFCVREKLNKSATRVMAVLDPIKVEISNLDDNYAEELPIENNPEAPESGSRMVPFSNQLYIERSDFMEDAPKKYFRLKPGGVVRLKGAYIIHCDEVIKNESGKIIKLKCSQIANSKSGSDTSGVKVKGTIHWVSAKHCGTAEARIYDRLFNIEYPLKDKDKDVMEFLNPDNLSIIDTIYIEPSLRFAKVGESFQFLRKGYFVLDSDSTSDKLIFNQAVSLRDGWAKKN
ncbi:MAG: glutamine--tRNA ligase/YqeY domain fusion protein [Chitinophagales bacterium]|nr:glutamine--tRNA ligase/YqeY domain fusion protein [Chitinophagales bacterium]